MVKKMKNNIVELRARQCGKTTECEYKIKEALKAGHKVWYASHTSESSLEMEKKIGKHKNLRCKPLTINNVFGYDIYDTIFMDNVGLFDIDIVKKYLINNRSTSVIMYCSYEMYVINELKCKELEKSICNLKILLRDTTNSSYVLKEYIVECEKYIKHLEKVVYGEAQFDNNIQTLYRSSLNNNNKKGMNYYYEDN